ncbi:MAG: glutathione S-transferase family protein [Loktanella sp.]|nr:glutathione S-transferase family protein [Loktanella sp.]
MFTLHYSPNSISVAVAIALEECAIPYTAVLVDFSQGAQTTPAFLKVNPKGRVPVLETPDGILTETGAILEYIAPDLVPADPFAAARMREIMYYVCGTMHVNHAHNRRGARWADDAASHADMKRKVPETMAASCAHLEQLWHLRPDGLTIADFYLYVVLCWLEGDGVDINAYPQLADFAQNMRARPSVQAVYDKGML